MLRPSADTPEAHSVLLSLWICAMVTALLFHEMRLNLNKIKKTEGAAVCICDLGTGLAVRTVWPGLLAATF